MKRYFHYRVNFFCVLALIIVAYPVVGSAGERSTDKPDDIYLIIYTTKSGHTGHVGIAVDNYKIVVRDTVIAGKTVSRYDTLKNLTLTYFDLWGPPVINWDQHNENLPCRYYKLPRSSSEKPITVDYFLTRGLPHSYDYPCDAMLRIKTTPGKDYQIKNIAEAIQQEKNYFNTRQYNCTDYVLLCLNRAFNRQIEAKEYIPFSWSSTPNRFYQAIVAAMKVEIVKKPGDEIKESFFKERILKTEPFNQFTHHEKNK